MPFVLFLEIILENIPNSCLYHYRVGESEVSEGDSDDSEVIPSSQLSTGFVYGIRAKPSQEYLESHPHLCYPMLSQPPIEVRYRTGLNDYKNVALELKKENIPPPFQE